MITSAKGQAHIKRFEGLSLTAYLCPARVWTIGWGHTGPEVTAGLTWTVEQCEAAFQADLRTAERAVAELVRVPLTPNQAASLASFVFNLGSRALANSTLLRRLNQGGYRYVETELARWVHADGRALPGLVRRREAERAMWRSTD